MNTNDQIKAIAKRETLVSLAQGIVQCCLCADKPEGTNPRATKQAIQAAESIAEEFIGLIGDDVLAETVGAYNRQYVRRSTNEQSLHSIGHDVWYTMQGHGMGFWDRSFLYKYWDDEPIELGQVLTDACRKLKRREPIFYRGWLYLE